MLAITTTRWPLLAEEAELNQSMLTITPSRWSLLAEEAELNQSMRHYTIEVVFIGGRSRIKSELAPLHHRGGLY
jgi:hypothetical protein